MSAEYIQDLRNKVAAAKTRMDEAYDYYKATPMFAGSNMMSWALAEEAYNDAVMRLKEAEN